MARTKNAVAEPQRVVTVAPVALLSLVFVATIACIGAFGISSATTLAGISAAGALVFAGGVTWSISVGTRELHRLHLLGLTDTLTGLPNRRALHDDFAKIDAPDTEIAIALIDLDGFMQVNDHYGHVVGDKVICEVGTILMEYCDDEATVYRLGGDEFALLQHGPLASTLLESICRRIVERLTRPVCIDDRRLTLGASIGLTRSAEDRSVSSSEMLRRADISMYASKRSGKARCTWFSEAFDESREQIREMDDELRSALAEEAFELHYQPLVECSTQRVVAVESLIRWNRTDGKKIGPNIFIPVAEESGLINAIGLWVLRRACRDALEWGDIKLSVNISAAQLRNPEFPIQLGHVLEETGFDPHRLELEVTETCLVMDPIVAERSLMVIRDFGVNVALDDFGTGYASIGFLRQFRFNKLKLDRSLVMDAAKDEGSRAMMLSSITVARAMKMDVTAEGVETQEQADMVRTAGCDQIQGWLYFRAMPADQIAQYLGHPIEQSASMEEEAMPLVHRLRA